MHGTTATKYPPCIAAARPHPMPTSMLPQRTITAANTRSNHSSRSINNRIYAESGSSTAETSAMTPAASSTDLAPNREGYRSFVMQGCEFLVRQTPDGFLSLSDTFVVDDATNSSKRAATVGDIPSDSLQLAPMEVAIEYPGNIFQGKEATKTVLKVYLTPILETEPAIKLDMQRVFLLDSAKRTVERLGVQRLAPPETPENELRVRIRDRLVVLDTVASLPTPEQVVLAAMNGGTALSQLEIEARAAAGGQGSVTQVEEISAINNLGSYDEDPNSDVLYDDELLKDFLVEIDDEAENEYDDYDVDMSG